MKCFQDEISNNITRKIKVGKLNFVDLAGSERARVILKHINFRLQELQVQDQKNVRK